MRKFTAICLCAILSGFSGMAVSGCGASGAGGCGGRSRSAFIANSMDKAAGSRVTILPAPFVKSASFEFSQRSGRASRFKATAGFDAFASVYRAVADESDGGDSLMPGPGETITLGTVPDLCGAESAWNMFLQVFDGRAAAGRRLQASHSYPIVGGETTSEEFSKIRFSGGNEAGDFIAQAGSIHVEAIDDKAVRLRLKDVHFVHVGRDNKPDGGGLFLLNGTIEMETNGL